MSARPPPRPRSRERVTDLIPQEREDLLILLLPAAVGLDDLLTDAGGVGPLLLLLVQLLQVDQRVAIPRIEPDDFLKGFEGAIDESAVTEIEAEAEQHVRVLERCQIRSLEQRLMHVDGTAHLSLLPVQVAENHLDFERVGVPLVACVSSSIA